MEKRAGCFAYFVFLMVVWLFLTAPWVCLRFVIVVFPDYTILEPVPTTPIALSACSSVVVDSYLLLRQFGGLLLGYC